MNQNYVLWIPVHNIAATISIAFGLPGIWAITAPDPGEGDGEPPIVARYWGRIMMLTACVLWAGCSFAPYFGSVATVGFWISRDAAMGIGVVAMCRYIQILCDRIPDARFSKSLALFWKVCVGRFILSLAATIVLDLGVRNNPLVSTLLRLVRGLGPGIDLLVALWALSLIGRLRRATISQE
jgi:hypothetical protein